MKRPERAMIFAQPSSPDHSNAACSPQLGHDQKLCLGSGTPFTTTFPKWDLKTKQKQTNKETPHPKFWETEKVQWKILDHFADSNGSCRKGNRGQNISVLSFFFQDKTSPTSVHLNCPQENRINKACTESEVTRTDQRKWVNSLWRKITRWPRWSFLEDGRINKCLEWFLLFL